MRDEIDINVKKALDQATKKARSIECLQTAWDNLNKACTLDGYSYGAYIEAAGKIKQLDLAETMYRLALSRKAVIPDQ